MKLELEIVNEQQCVNLVALLAEGAKARETGVMGVLQGAEYILMIQQAWQKALSGGSSGDEVDDSGAKEKVDGQLQQV